MRDGCGSRDSLRSRGIRLAILTNGRQATVEATVAAAFHARGKSSGGMPEGK